MGLGVGHSSVACIFAAAMLLGSTTGTARESAKVRSAAVLARVLSYELTLEDRAGDSVGVAVVYKPGDIESEANANEWYRALADLSSVKIKDRRFFAEKVPYGASEIRTAIEKDGVDVLLVTDGLAAEALPIAQMARSAHVLTAGNSVSYLDRALTLCVSEEDGKPKIFINLNMAHLEGIRFSSNLLKLVTLVH